MSKPTIEISSVSVKVMRSYDYCHFEVQLAAVKAGASITEVEADGLRKEAARLADKAVEQYKTAKRNAELMALDVTHIGSLEYQTREALKTPENERTPEDKALIKRLEDARHRNRPRYDYQDDWIEPEDEGQDQYEE